MSELDHIGDYLGLACRLAKKSQFSFLAYLIEIAQLEAGNLKQGTGTTLSAPKRRSSLAIDAKSKEELRMLKQLPERDRAALMSSLIDEAIREVETG